MTEYRVTYTKIPTAYHDKRVMFVEAANATDAEVLARHHIERRNGIRSTEFVFRVEDAKVGLPAGRVISAD